MEIPWTSNGKTWKTDHHLVHQATCENTRRNHQKRVGDIYLAMSLCFDHASMQMQWRGSTLSIDADFSTSQTVSLPKCKLPNSTMLVYWRYNGCIYIYISKYSYLSEIDANWVYKSASRYNGCRTPWV